MLLLGAGQEARRSACPALRTAQAISISLRARVCRPSTRTHVRLLGPCFKTGRISPVASHDPGRAASGDAGRGEREPRPARDQAGAVPEGGGVPCGRWLDDRDPQRGREAPEGKED